MPRSLRNAPVLEDGYQTSILRAFWTLSTCRSLGMSVGPIPWTAMDQWATRQGYDECQVEYDCFMALMHELDGLFMDHALGEASKVTKRPPKTSRR